MTRHNRPVFKHRVIARCTFAALLALNLGQASSTVFSQSPFVGVGGSYPPNVLLALSVEFPTAGAAYNTKLLWANSSLLDTDPEKKFYKLNVPGISTELKEELPTLTKTGFEEGSFIGYFDQNKCYRYENERFVPVAATDDGYCNGTGQYSGKAMNWLTMTSVDIYRLAMTGGNRAVGTGSAPDNYSEGDRRGYTALRRAYVNMSAGLDRGRNGQTGIGLRRIARDLAETGRVLPNTFKVEEYSYTPYKRDSNGKIVTQTVNGKSEKVLDTGKTAVLDGIFLHNSDFRMALMNKDGSYKLHNVVVEVCKSGMLEANCRPYSGGSKPEGLMQANINKMRFSVFGYLNNVPVAGKSDTNRDINGGVMRARMKSLRGETTADGVVLGEEVNLSDGTFYVDPDKTDAADSGVTNSGVINYLNKFGDAGRYRYYDTAAELYYAGLRYLRGVKKNVGYYENLARNPQAMDGFPVITKWDDPLMVGNPGSSEQERLRSAVCRPNYMMYLGDTNVHNDNSVPGFTAIGSAHENEMPGDDAEVQTGEALQELLALETSDKISARGDNPGLWGALGFKYGDSLRGAAATYGAIAGLASWARTHDIRSDIGGRQVVNSMMIDVVENNDYKASASANKNPFYWAAKYGGFDADEVEKNGGVPAIRSRSQWTGDAPGQTSRGDFGVGVPRNYVLANTPDNMISALKRAFNNIDAKSETPSQTALGVAQNSGSLIDFSASGKGIVLQSSYKKNDWGWQGDVIARSITSSGYQEEWKLSQKLSAIPNPENTRMVWSKGSSGIARFYKNNAAQFSDGLFDNNLTAAGSTATAADAANLIDYVLGGRAHENDILGQSFRRRPSDGLLGTVVNSEVAVLPKPERDICQNNTRFDRLKNRNPVYAFAANDGMLHIVGTDGSEKFAYLPSTALPKLKEYASPNDRHVYINDGSPVAGEVCIGNTQTSVVVGSAGRGGEAVYAVDASLAGNAGYKPSESDVLWEFTSADDNGLGQTVHKPVLGRVEKGGGQTVPAAVFSSGYNAKDGKGYLFILEIGRHTRWTKDSNYWRIPLGQSGVGAPKVIDSNNDGTIDRIYVGDEAGTLWRVTNIGGTWSADKLFTGSRPITGAPDVLSNGSNYTVVFSTGQYFNDADNAAQQQEQNYAYGLFDKGTPISEADLLRQQISEVPATSVSTGNGARTFFKSTENRLGETHAGWRLALPIGFTASDDALIRRRKTAQFFAFTTKADSSNAMQCTTTGQSAVIEVDLYSGSMYVRNLFDTNNDTTVNTGDTPAAMMVSSEGLALKRTNVNLRGRDQSATATEARILWVGDSGKILHMNLNPLPNATRRLNWREIFF